MTNLPGPARDDAQHLLAATRDLSRRVRVAQRGAWFPLLAFAAVTLAAIPFNRYGPHPRHCSAHACIVLPELSLWYWPVAVVAGYVAISWFYLRRSEQRGVGSRVQPYIAVGVLLSLFTAAWALWADTHPSFLADTLHLLPGRPTDFSRVMTPAVAIGLALLLLAWIERSWPLFTLTAVYLVVAVATVGLGRFARPTPWAFLPHYLVDSGVLLIGAMLLAVIQRVRRPSTA